MRESFKEAVILAGGKGERLQPFTCFKPKPLLDVGGVPLLQRQVRWLYNNGINHVIVSAGYMGRKFINQIDKLNRMYQSNDMDLEISLYIEDDFLGTAGGLKKSSRFLINDKYFYVINGDILTDINLNNLKNIYDKYGNSIIGSVKVPDPASYGTLEIKDDYIKSFKEKGNPINNWINAGVYLLTSNILKMIPDNKFYMLEDYIFPFLAQSNELNVCCFDNYWIDIGNIDKYIQVHEDLMNGSVENYFL